MLGFTRWDVRKDPILAYQILPPIIQSVELDVFRFKSTKEIATEKLPNQALASTIGA